jgi:flagellar secretion chaperone FliS
VTAGVNPASPAAARNEYLKAAVTTATQEKLVLLLYDGALQALARADRALSERAQHEAGRALGKALAIVGELRASLDLEAGGEIAGHLFALYGFVNDRIIKANVTRDREPIAEARAILSKLKEGWDGIVRAS